MKRNTVGMPGGRRVSGVGGISMGEMQAVTKQIE